MAKVKINKYEDAVIIKTAVINYFVLFFITRIINPVFVFQNKLERKCQSRNDYYVKIKSNKIFLVSVKKQRRLLTTMIDYLGN